MKSFRIVYLDDDMKTFSLSMPTVDDTSVINATVELQEQGRNVRITTVDSCADINEIKQYYQRLGFRFDSKTIW